LHDGSFEFSLTNKTVGGDDSVEKSRVGFLDFQGNFDVFDLGHVVLVEDTNILEGLEVHSLATIELSHHTLDEVLLSLVHFDGLEKTRIDKGLESEFLTHGDLLQGLKNGDLLFSEVKANNLLEGHKLLSGDAIRVLIN